MKTKQVETTPTKQRNTLDNDPDKQDQKAEVSRRFSISSNLKKPEVLPPESD